MIKTDVQECIEHIVTNGLGYRIPSPESIVMFDKAGSIYSLTGTAEQNLASHLLMMEATNPSTGTALEITADAMKEAFPKFSSMKEYFSVGIMNPDLFEGITAATITKLHQKLEKPYLSLQRGKRRR